LEFLVPLTIHKQDGVALTSMGEGWQAPFSCSIYSAVALADFGHDPRSIARAGEPGEILFFFVR